MATASNSRDELPPIPAKRYFTIGEVSEALARLLAVVENYPQLKADGSFQKLQAELSDIENKIAAARRYFNNATNEYNTAIRQFPAVRDFMLSAHFAVRP